MVRRKIKQNPHAVVVYARVSTEEQGELKFKPLKPVTGIGAITTKPQLNGCELGKIVVG